MPTEITPDWIAVMSFSAEQDENPEFQAVLEENMNRWKDEAGRAGLDPATNVKVERRDGELCILISAALDKFFTPPQTEWWAV
jgi:hypothetical protein